jgi:hypothetical protein
MSYQQKQIEVINKIEKQINTNSIRFSTVTPTTSYDNDRRICLTSVHFPHRELLEKIENNLINSLNEIQANHYYYPQKSLHITIKNVRVINDPPNFDQKDVSKVKKVFEKVIPKHHQFKTYFYRLLLFPSNLALIGTTDPELDKIIFDLDKNLEKVNFSDDKQYTNNKYFFCNMTLVRFTLPVSEEFRQKVVDLSKNIKFDPYIIDSVTLLSANAVLKKRQISGVWSLST